MLRKRIIPCLDVHEGRVVKGINFVNLRDAGDPAILGELYQKERADELVFLDISASAERRRTMARWVEAVAQRLCIPFTVGGGISSADQAVELVRLGADKISLNTAAVRRPELITECARLLGNQAVVCAVDVRRKNGSWEVVIEGGRTPTEKDAFTWIEEAENRGAGEILLTSMDRDGTKEGYDTELLEKVCSHTCLPVIASGGAGEKTHFLEAFQAGAEAALAASLFHFGLLRIGEVKNYLQEQDIPVRL
jgi:cyclase